MWGDISTVVSLGGLLWLIASLFRLITRRGFAPSPLEELSPGARRRLMQRIRYGGLKPEQHDIARRWAVRELARRDYCWITTAVLLIVAFRQDADSTAWFSLVVSLVGVVGLVLTLVYLWRDQRAAARVLRGTSPPA